MKIKIYKTANSWWYIGTEKKKGSWCSISFLTKKVTNLAISNVVRKDKPFCQGGVQKDIPYGQKYKIIKITIL